MFYLVDIEVKGFYSGCGYLFLSLNKLENDVNSQTKIHFRHVFMNKMIKPGKQTPKPSEYNVRWKWNWKVLC